MNTFVIDVWNRLLQDIHAETGIVIDAPSVGLYEWLLHEGPLVEKQILAYLEHGTDCKVVVPEWLMPLWESFIQTDDPAMLRYIRQVLLFINKTEEEPTNEQLRDAQKAFEQTDEDTGCWSRAYSSAKSFNHTLHTARRIVGSVIYRTDWTDITPAHGPGGVFPPELPVGKSRFCTIYANIQRYYPHDQYFCGLPNYWVDHYVENRVGSINEEEHIVAKMVAVPKDSRGPRLICVHPKEAIWIQQGQRQLLEAAISSSPITGGRINFTDQTVNGKLALLSSISREYVTLDLKEASDRMSCLLVRDLLGPHAYKMLSCSRATKIKLLDGRVIVLKKWAPMGNALTFPVQSLVFFALVVAGIRARYGVNCTDVYVFGDDIIFPSSYYDGAVRALVLAGFIPNSSKTFRRGFFRESCGIDAYKGGIVTPFRIKKGSINSLSSVVSSLDLAKRLRLAGYNSCASYLYKTCRAFLRHQYGICMPITNNDQCTGLVEYQDIPFTELLLRQSLSYDSKLQKWDVRCMLVAAVVTRICNGDWYHLQDSLLRLERGYAPRERRRHQQGISLVRNYQCTASSPDAPHWDENPVEMHLSDRATEYAVPHRTRLKRGWAGIKL